MPPSSQLSWFPVSGGGGRTESLASATSDCSNSDSEDGGQPLRRLAGRGASVASSLAPVHGVGQEARKARGTCPRCNRVFADLLDHFKKRHPDIQWRPEQLTGVGLLACPCGAPVRNAQGLKVHQSRARCQPQPTRAVVPSSESPEWSVTPEQTPAPAPPLGPSEGQADRSAWDRLLELAHFPTVSKPLPLSWKNRFLQVVGRLSDNYLASPSDESLLHLLALPKAGLARALSVAREDKSAGETHLQSFPAVLWPLASQFNPETFERSANLSTRIKRAVAMGKLSRASRMLSDESGIAPVDEATLAQLRAQHPSGDALPFADTTLPSVPAAPDLEELLYAFREFKPETGAAVSGWNQPLMKLALQNKSFQSFMVLLCAQVARGTAPGQQMLCASRLTPLVKPGGGVRPIAVGELFYRLITKALHKKFRAPDALLPTQLGVKTPGGVEPLVRVVELMSRGELDEFHWWSSNPESQVEMPLWAYLTSLDWKNAFNSLSRSTMAAAIAEHCPQLLRTAKWAYDNPTPLVIGSANGTTHVLQSSNGVRQGDPLGPLFFSIGIRALLERLETALGEEHVVMAYLDDIFIISKEPGALLAAKRAVEGNPEGLSLNVSKCREYTRGEIQSSGVRLLGTCVGPFEARNNFATEAVRASIDKLEALMETDVSAQVKLLLVRMCIQQEQRHLLRSLDTRDCSDLWVWLDSVLQDAALQSRGSEQDGEYDQDIASLPVREGGLGILSHGEIAPHARVAAKHSSDNFLAPVLASKGIVLPPIPSSHQSQGARCKVVFRARREELLQRLSQDQRLQLLDGASLLGRKWLGVIPFTPTLHLSDREVGAALQRRTLLASSQPLCERCGLPSGQNHSDTCPAMPNNRMARHEQAKHLFCRHLGRASRTSVEKEPICRNSLLRTDIRATGPGASNGLSSEHDLAIYTLFSSGINALRRNQTAAAILEEEQREEAAARELEDEDNGGFEPAPPRVGPRAPSLARHTTLLLRARLDLHSRDKARKYSGQTHSPFVPLVFSLGGSLSSSTLSAFKHWKVALPSFSELCCELSLLFVRAQAQYYVL